MKLLAAYIMRGRMQAILVTAVSALLSLLLPPFSYISGAAVGLVTLRAGPVPGLGVIGGGALAVGVLAAMIFGQPWMAAILLAILWLPVWGLSVSLRRTVSLARTLVLSGLFGAALVLGVYLAVDDPAGWWLETYRQLVVQAGSSEPDSEVLAGLKDVAGIMTGAAAAAFTLSVLGSVFIARWWQAVLYNPGGFREEFHGLAVGRPATIAALALVAAASLGGEFGAVAAELLIVVLFLFLVQGLAIVHGLVAKAGASIGWLIATYLLLIVALPQTAVTLSVVGLVDNWFNFRAFFGRGKDRNES